VQERLKGIYKLVKQIQEEKVRNEGNLNAVIKAHEKLMSDDKISPYHKVFLIPNYKPSTLMNALKLISQN